MIEKIREKIKEADGFLIFSPANLYYLTGFTGSGALFITQKDIILFVDFLYQEQSKQEVKNIEIYAVRDSFYEKIAKHTIFTSVKKIFVEDTIRISMLDELKKNFEKKEFVPIKGVVEELRKSKKEEEINNIREAIRIAEKSYTNILSIIKEGITENEVAIELEYQMKKLGADGIAFPTIVASGENSALPHARASKRKIKEGDVVIIDFGAVYNHYCCDMTRTIIIGENKEAEKIYNIVKKAQNEAIKGIEVGKELKEIDSIARNIIKDAGYDEYFGHGLGHGVGLEVHEAPSIKKISEGKVDENIVVTIEPGIYLPGKFGVRVEDMVLVRKDKIEVLTSLPK